MWKKYIPGKERREAGGENTIATWGLVWTGQGQYLLINHHIVQQKAFVEKITTFHITHFSTETFKLTAALMKSSFPHFC